MIWVAMRNRVLLISCAIFALISACAPAQDTTSPLRLAITDLMRTCGNTYPHGREYLARLDDIEAALASTDAGKVTTLVDVPNGIARDPEVDFSGRKIVFSMRRDQADSYHIHEINADGSGLRQIGRLGQLTSVDFNGNASWNGNRGPLISFDRPELSPCLARIADKNSEAYKEALAIITSGQQNLKERPDCDMPGFQPCPADAERLARAKILAGVEKENRKSIANNKKLRDRE